MVSLVPSAPARISGHPKGLYLLFATEMWERMSYYGMRALLTLYMVAATERGGFGWDRAFALKIYGAYTALVYLTPVAGGWLADNVLGQRRAVLIGGVVMMLGHFLMAVPGHVAFFAALASLIIGNGLFKPNISTMVGGLYEAGDARRDGAFTIFYMGINLGAFLSPLVCGTLGEKLGWHWGFGSAGVGMGLGLLTFLALHKKLLGSVGLTPEKKPVTITGPGTTGDALSEVEKDRIGVILTLTFFNIFFWAAFEQAGGLMNLYTDEKVDRVIGAFTVPTTWFQALNPLFILVLAPFFSALWANLGERGKDPSTPVKMGFGLVFLASGFVLMMGAAQQTAGGAKAHMLWIIGAYFLHTVGELCLSPVGLSMVSRLAPARLTSLMMGVWFLSSFVANYLAGLIGGASEKLGELQLFGAIVAATTLAGLVLWALAKGITAKMHEQTAQQH
jgi:proton-dependent oligopeptide transporter, POT family